MLLALVLIVFLINRFVADLTLINSELIAFAAMADVFRYGSLVLMIVVICHQVSQNYELQLFDRLFAMPITRVQFVLAQFILVMSVAFLLAIPILLTGLLNENINLTIYWFLAVFLELLLVGQFASLSAISLEKLPVAIIFTLALYLFTRSLPLIDLIINESMPYYQQEGDFHFYQWFISFVQYLMPLQGVFAQNNVLFVSESMWNELFKQMGLVFVYGFFIQFIIMLDFYRKEFNLT